MLKFFWIILLVGCGLETSQRNPSSLDITDFAPILAPSLPPAFVNKVNNSPKLCAEDTCITIGEALASFFNSDIADSLTHNLGRLDSRANRLEQRTLNHYAPCLESQPIETTVKFNDKYQLTYQSQCFSEYIDEAEKFEQYEQMTIGKSESEQYVLNRRGIANTDVRTVGIRLSSSNDLEVWMAHNLSVANAGANFFRLATSNSGQLVQITTAGREQFTVKNAFQCGVRISLNKDLIYIAGKLQGYTSTTSPITPCDLIGESTYCLNGADLSSMDIGACHTISDFGFDQFLPAEMESEDWGETIRFDFSESVPRFRLEGLEIFP